MCTTPVGTAISAGNSPGELQPLCHDCRMALHAGREWVNVGCLRTLVWVVMVAVAMQAVWLLIVSVMRGLGVS
jgi:hypothetical protein